MHLQRRYEVMRDDEGAGWERKAGGNEEKMVKVESEDKPKEVDLPSAFHILNHLLLFPRHLVCKRSFRQLM